MSAPQRLLESRHDARGAIIVITLVAFLRLQLERGLLSHSAVQLPPLGVMMPAGNAVFYALCFWLFSALLAPLLGRSHRQVGNLVLVGLVIAVLPPLIELSARGDATSPRRAGTSRRHPLCPRPAAWPWIGPSTSLYPDTEITTRHARDPGCAQRRFVLDPRQPTPVVFRRSARLRGPRQGSTTKRLSAAPPTASGPNGSAVASPRR